MKNPIFGIACAAAAVIQMLHLATYYALTDGCFCAAVDSSPPVPRSPILARYLEVADLYHRLGFRGQVGGIAVTLVFSFINFVLWAVIIFLGLKVFSLMYRGLRRARKAEMPAE